MKVDYSTFVISPSFTVTLANQLRFVKAHGPTTVNLPDPPAGGISAPNMLVSIN